MSNLTTQSGQHATQQNQIPENRNNMIDPFEYNLELPHQTSVRTTPNTNNNNYANRPSGISPKNTKASLRIATFNIRGFQNSGSSRSETKWNHINQLIRDKKIGILTVQEAHLNEDRRVDIEKLFGRRMKVLYSADLDNPTGRGGVAIVLNRDLINVRESSMIEISAGRAMLVSVKWHKEEVINILNVYAPNVTETDGTKNMEFWNNLKQFFIHNPQIKVDVLMGDFNIVEDSLDRTPMRTDPCG